MEASKYYGALHFLHSTAWVTETIRQKWYRIVFESGKTVKVNGKTILAGDGVKQSKEGRHMPGVEYFTRNQKINPRQSLSLVISLVPLACSLVRQPIPCACP